jgi:hypothetical protein
MQFLQEKLKAFKKFKAIMEKKNALKLKPFTVIG